MSVHSSSADIFTDLLKNKEILDEILSYADLLTCGAGEEIALSDTRSFYFVKKGIIDVSYTANDTRITVALLGNGTFFGEIGFFDGGSRVRDIRASEEAHICRFTTLIMENLSREKPHLYCLLVTHLSRLICQKFRRVLEENEPVISYAASLSIKRKSFSESKPIPESFLKSSAWHTVNKEIEAAKSELFNLSYRLQEEDPSKPTDEKITRDCFHILDTINDNIAKTKNIMANLEDEGFIWGYIFKEIFPYIMRSRFVERAYYKPKGYAGDFLMMEHIYRNKPKGDGRIGEIVDAWCLQRPGAKAIRGRRKLLAMQLTELTGQFVATSPHIKIMNLACGPNRELFDFLAECDYSEKIEALCVDIDSEALQFTNRNVNIFPHRASIRLMNENLVKWSLGRVSQQIAKQHIIYSAGLCDYLDKRLFQAMITRCHEHLEPGGKLILGNFAPYVDQVFMDEILHWHLLYRTPQDLLDIFKDTPFGSNVKILSEPEGVNLFALANKEK